MRKVNTFKKTLLIIFILIIGFLIMYLNSSFGDFTETVYDLFLNPILFLIYLILSLIIYFKFELKKEYYYLFLIPITFVLLSFIWKKDLHKNIFLEGIIESSKGSTIKLFDNNSYKIKIQYQHGADYKKGNYQKKGNEIVLKTKNIEKLTDSLFTKKYRITENKELEPIGNKKFETITVINAGLF